MLSFSLRYKKLLFSKKNPGLEYNATHFFFYLQINNLIIYTDLIFFKYSRITLLHYISGIICV